MWRGKTAGIGGGGHAVGLRGAEKAARRAHRIVSSFMRMCVIVWSLLVVVVVVVVVVVSWLLTLLLLIIVIIITTTITIITIIIMCTPNVCYMYAWQARDEWTRGSYRERERDRAMRA